MIQEVEHLSHCFHMDTLTQSKCPAETCIQVERIKTSASIPPDHQGQIAGTCCGIASETNTRTACRGLDCVSASHNVEWERRVIAQDSTELEAMAKCLPERVGGCEGSMQGRIEHYAVPLIVVRASPILMDVEVVEWRTEEELAHVIQCFGIGVRDPETAILDGPLNVRYGQAIIFRVGGWRVLLVVLEGGIRAAQVDRINGGCTGWRVQVL